MAVSSCMDCGRCCTSFGVCVTPFDIVRIMEATGTKPSEFMMSIPEPQERERKEPYVLIDGRRSLIVLRWSRNMDCLFHRSHGCGIYRFRPMLCRTYPFSKDENSLKEMGSRACPQRWRPGGYDTQVYLADMGGYESEIGCYRKIALEWNSTGGGTMDGFISFAVSKARAKKDTK